MALTLRTSDAYRCARTGDAAQHTGVLCKADLDVLRMRRLARLRRESPAASSKEEV